MNRGRLGAWDRKSWRMVYKRAWGYYQLDDLEVTYDQVTMLRAAGRVFSLRYDYPVCIAERIELTHEEAAMVSSTGDPYWVLGLDDGGSPVRLVILPSLGEAS